MLQTFTEPTLSYHLSTDFISSSICLHQASFTKPFKFLILANFFFFFFLCHNYLPELQKWQVMCRSSKTNLFLES